MKPVIYLAGDIIYKASTDSDCMYFIASGTVVLITFSGREVRDCTCLRKKKNELLFRLKLQLSNKMFLKICHLHDGDHFGEAGMVHSDRRRAESVIALEVCELLRLHRRDFKRLFAKSSEFYHSLEHIARERSQKIKKLNEEHERK